jgi:UDP-N-acetyl-D-mannosaminuronate dehydrogenase
MPSLIDTLLDRIRAREARVGVIGLGYVGLPLAVEFARAGYRSPASTWTPKAAQINAGKSYIPDVPTRI